MRKALIIRFLLLAVAVLLHLSAASAQSKKPKAAPATTVYVVRHAEKDLTPGLADPLLTPAGEVRALALRQKLRRQRVVAIFTTDTRRTRATVAPLAAARHLTPQVYDARNLAALASRIKTEYAGQTVLVVGHSNTILETAEALGAARPVPTVADAEFDYLLKVTLSGSAGPASTAVAEHYGAGRK
jgi:probable phosphoglycerate mutase